MKLNWIKCEGGRWCPCLTVNLGNTHFTDLSGVYVIWHGGSDPATVYVGSGDIAERIRDHRTDRRILQYSHFGLFVTWARVPPSKQPGVERFLADSLNPKVGERHPQAAPISVNFPWN